MATKRKVRGGSPTPGGMMSESVQRRLFWLVRSFDRTSRARAELFERRNGIKSSLDELDRDDKMRHDLLSEYGEVVINIGSLNAQAKALGQEVAETIRRAEQGELIDVAPEARTFLSKKGTNEDEDEDEDENEEDGE